MSLIAPDALIESRVRAGLQNISKNPDYLDEPLGHFLPQGAEDVKSFFRGRNIPVLGGWPSEAQQVPCVTVQLRPSVEMAERQLITEVAHMYQGDNLVVLQGSFWQSAIMCTCYGNSQREATYLALIVKWLLLILRTQLTLEGLMEQVLTISDYEPVPAMFDPTTPWFLRTVTLSCTHQDTIAITEGPLIADILVTAQDDGRPDS